LPPDPTVTSMKTLAASLALAAALLPAPANAQALATATVEFREVGLTYAAEGAVEAIRTSTLAAQVPGRIVELRVNVGDAVAKGQVLARIDAREAAQGVAAGQAQVARAQADLANATVNLERSRKLVAQNFVSKAALDKAQADYDASRAQLAAARASTSQAVTVQDHTVITAPYAGLVSERLVELGDMAQPGRPLLTVFDPKDLRAVAYVPQDRTAAIRTGEVAVEILALNQRIKAGRVTVLPSADPRTHTTQVRVDLPEGLKGVYPGQFARVHFTIGSAKKLMIPAQAVVYRSEVAGAYVVAANGEISLRQLRLGEAAGEAGIEVLAGITPGEKVALDPVAALAALKKARAK
jgi:membrane fusion protein, multidrug efflux system